MVLELKAQTREVQGKKVQKLRDKGIIPAVVYGPDKEPHMIKLERSELEKVYRDAGGNTVISLSIDEGKTQHDVLIHELDRDPITEFVKHVDFYCFKAGHKLNTEIPLNFIGEPRTIKEAGATLVTQIEDLSVRCLAKDLVASIDVDLTKIQTVDDSIKVSDLTLPAGIEVDHEADDIIAVTIVPQEEEEIDTEVTAEMPEVEKKGKKEEEGAEA